MEVSAQQEQTNKISLISNVNTNNTKPSSIIVVTFVYFNWYIYIYIKHIVACILCRLLLCHIHWTIHGHAKKKIGYICSSDIVQNEMCSPTLVSERTRHKLYVGELSATCHTRFPEGNQMHLICVPGSSSTHMTDEMSVVS
jgi:hypothetical protein